MFKQSLRLVSDRDFIDPQASAHRAADNDPRIGRAWRDGRLIYCALVDQDVVQSQDILEVYERLPSLDAA